MTPTDWLSWRLVGRLGVLTLIVAVLLIFDTLPSVLNLDASGTEMWRLAGWIASPFLAGSAAWRAASKCAGSARKAWHSFGLGCFSWMAATLTWASYGWMGSVLPFPSLADPIYLFSAAMFMIGMFHYSLAGSGGNRIKVTNFALAMTSVVAVGFIIYFPVLAESQSGWPGALVAFAYPTVWISTFAFGLICYCLYVPPRRSFPLLLILGAVGSQAVGDFYYGFDVLRESFSTGVSYHLFWIANFALMTWAAVEHRPATGRPLRPAGEMKLGKFPGEALIPAVSVASILLAGLVSNWPHLKPSAPFVAPLLFGFAALLAIREHALVTTERGLRTKAEDSTRRLAASERRLSGVLQNTTDGVMVLDREWRIIFANRNAVDMLFSDRPYLGVRIWDLRRTDQTREFYKNYSAAMKNQTAVEFEAYLPPLDLWLEVHAFPTPDNLTVFFRDVTERRRLREELVRLARQDPLTELANRTLFGERLALGLQSGRRHGGLILLLIDLDGFKGINDSLGHMAGDCLLQQFSKRLASLVRHGDTVARFGGDEFAIIQPGPIEPEGGIEVARRVCEALLMPFAIQGTEITLAVSIGVAIAPQHGQKPEDLIFNADLALYRAKETKGTGSNFCIYEPGMEDPVQSRQPLRPNPQWAGAKG